MKTQHVTCNTQQKWFGNLDQQQFTTVGDVTSAYTWTTLKKTTKGVVKSTPELRNLLAALFMQYSDDGFVPGLNMRSGRVATSTQPGDANPQAQTAGARPKKTIAVHAAGRPAAAPRAPAHPERARRSAPSVAVRRSARGAWAAKLAALH
eukprot:SAG31_NODE_11938_length_983_cov_2.699095_1_plen_150_part_00